MPQSRHGARTRARRRTRGISRQSARAREVGRISRSFSDCGKCVYEIERRPERHKDQVVHLTFARHQPRERRLVSEPLSRRALSGRVTGVSFVPVLAVWRDQLRGRGDQAGVAALKGVSDNSSWAPSPQRGTGTDDTLAGATVQPRRMTHNAALLYRVVLMRAGVRAYMPL